MRDNDRHDWTNGGFGYYATEHDVTIYPLNVKPAPHTTPAATGPVAKEILKLARDAKRWKKLMVLLGTPRDGSDTPVKMFWDDATMTPFIVVGKTSYYHERGSFEAVIDSLIDQDEEQST